MTNYEDHRPKMTTHTKHLPEGWRLERRYSESHRDPWDLRKGGIDIAKVDEFYSNMKWVISHLYHPAPEFKVAVEAILVTFRDGMQADVDACDQSYKQQRKAESDAAYAALLGGDVPK